MQQRFDARVYMNGFWQRALDRIFSGKYVHEDINLLQTVMYRAAYPCAVLLNKLRLSPNQITTLSIGFAIMAFAALVLDPGWAYYTLFWGLSVLLDFCDGTVARMTNRTSVKAFRYDHMSDLFKLCLLFFGVGIRYDTSLTWSAAALVIFLFMYFTLLTHDLLHVRKITGLKSSPSTDESVTVDDAAGIPAPRLRERYRPVAWLVKHDRLYRLFRILWPPLTTISGHSLLLFFLFPLGPEWSLAVFAYLGLLTLLGIRGRIAQLLNLPKP
ncbi:MAG: CDP-alcohol phosphatidyltransferase family protein [Gammaproteobacteria bacterium]